MRWITQVVIAAAIAAAPLVQAQTVSWPPAAAVPYSHSGAGCPPAGPCRQGTVSESSVDATICYCKVDGIWWPIVESASGGPEVVATWSALPATPGIGDQAFVESSSLLVTWTDADPVDLWLPEPWASEVQGRIVDGSANALYLSVAAGDDELTDLTSRGWAATGTPTFDTDHFIFDEARVTATPSAWPTKRLYAVKSDCAQASGTSGWASFAPAEFDGTKTAIISKSHGVNASSAVANQTAVMTASGSLTMALPAGTGYEATTDGDWHWLAVDAAGVVTLIHSGSAEREVVAYSALTNGSIATDVLWIGVSTAVSNAPVLHVSEFHAFDLDAP